MIHIVADSMSDVPQERARALGVHVLPQPIRFGDEEFWDDGVSITKETFFARMRQSQELPKTSQVPVGNWLECFNQLLQAAENEIVCITGSSKLSGCYQAACLAREACEDPERVRVIDSLNATTAETMMVEYAAAQRDAGKTAREIEAAVRDMMARCKIIGMADDLRYLVLGGRMPSFVGKLGTALNVKPTLKIEGGEVLQAGLARGQARARAWYVEQLKLFPPDLSLPVYIGGADCPEQVALIKKQLEGAGLVLPELRCVEIGCLIGTYVGPGLTLVAWTRKK